jgi:hypothetical protein
MRFPKTLTFLILAMALVSAVRAMAQQQRPFSREQVSKMVQAGLGDASRSKLIEQRGIDFAPAEDFLQTLKAAGL